MDEEPTGGPEEAADEAARREEQRAEDEIVGLPWDDELPVALGEDVGESTAPSAEDQAIRATNALDPAGPADEGAEAAEGAEVGEDYSREADPIDTGDDMGELSETDDVGGRRNALPRRVESWRSRSATGAIATAIAMGLQQVFEPERRRPAAVAEAPSDPYDDDDPITVDYVPDDAEGTTVHVKPWLLQKGEPG